MAAAFKSGSPAATIAQELSDWPPQTTEKRVRWQDYIHQQNRNGRLTNEEAIVLLDLVNKGASRKRRRAGKARRRYSKLRRR